jgi:hypothetical protein
VSLNFLKIVFENFCQRRDSRYGVIPDVRECNLRISIFNAFDMSLAAMTNLLVDDNFGIGKLWRKNSSVLMMRSLAVAAMYTF